ncbi:MBL fold metallo-hydrolase [Gracilibacillus alcaliphilus]|uniref:MBL fold metallo-hydrolase n=1 Tax=Gracilibacillus alcaliphilus TaxID=1401441 RepID=UPI00195E64A1|nr:MBL fold metallo-hydrolase [Gracilibacillus alcaliphilus]MBM7679750.1 glyoxylase-like metal-dependent hydrolase (beta-lactamase superfamily II) [Gracilibacillus alcaliphilus]
MNVVNIGYGSTNYYAVNHQKTYLLIDVGLPGTFGMMKNQLQKYGIHFKDIQYLIVTHFHPDHCGIAQEVQSLGVEMIISRTQLDFLETANESMKKYSNYKKINIDSKNILNENDKNSFYERFGMPGYMLHTPGHTDDSISIVIKGLGIFTGDLPLVNQTYFASSKKVEESWAQIRNTNEKRIFPGHGNSFTF